MWPRAKTNTLVLAVMCSVFVSLQPPAQRLKGMDKESCWRVLMGWVEGLMCDIVVVPLKGFCFRGSYDRDCFESNVELQQKSGCLAPQLWHNSKHLYQMLLNLDFESPIENEWYTKKYIFTRSSFPLKDYLHCYFFISLCHIVSQQHKAFPRVESYCTSKSNCIFISEKKLCTLCDWIVTCLSPSVSPLCLPLFFTHFLDLTAHRFPHANTCLLTSLTLWITSTHLTETQKWLLDTIQ